MGVVVVLEWCRCNAVTFRFLSGRGKERARIAAGKGQTKKGKGKRLRVKAPLVARHAILLTKEER